MSLKTPHTYAYALLKVEEDVMDDESTVIDQPHTPSQSRDLCGSHDDCSLSVSHATSAEKLRPVGEPSIVLSTSSSLLCFSRELLFDADDSEAEAEAEDDRHTRLMPTKAHRYTAADVSAALTSLVSQCGRPHVLLLIPSCILLVVVSAVVVTSLLLPSHPDALSALQSTSGNAAITATAGHSSSTASLFLFLDQVFPVHVSLLAEHCWDVSSVVPWSIDSVSEQHAAESGALVLQEHEDAMPSREQLTALLQQRDAYPLSLTQRAHRHMHAYFLHHRAATQAGSISAAQLQASGYRPLTDTDTLREARVRVLVPSLQSHNDLRSISLNYSHQQYSPAADDVVTAQGPSVVDWPIGVHLVFYVLLDDSVDDVSGGSNVYVRNCLGGYPIVVYLAGAHMKKRPLIRDMYHGLYQVVASSLQTVGLHWLSIETADNSHATFAVNFTDDEHTMRVAASLDPHWLTLPVHPHIARHQASSTATAAQTTNRGECTDAHFDIDNEWNGEWLRLGSSVDSATSASTVIGNGEQSLCPVVPPVEQSASSSVEHVLPVCSGVFPSNTTSPTASTMPWVYTRSSCMFHQYSVDESLSCLHNAWLLVIGDSNMQDYKRNLVGLLLGARHVWKIEQPRATDDVWTLQPAPNQPVSASGQLGDSHVRITQVFDGHHDENNNFEGMFSFRFASMESRLRSLFNGSAAAAVNVSGTNLPPVPSHVIFMSGLHDAFSARQLDRVGGWVLDLPAERTVRTLDEPVVPLFDQRQLVNATVLEPRVLSTELIGLPVSSFRLQVRRVVQLFDELSGLHPLTSRTQFVWRTTVSPLTAVVGLSFQQSNIWTVRQFNAVVISELRRYTLQSERQNASHPTGIRWRLNDQYDLTYSWSNTVSGVYSDGGHYGRKPPPCEYGTCINNPFVEITQVHVSVNMMCNHRRSGASTASNR